MAVTKRQMIKAIMDRTPEYIPIDRFAAATVPTRSDQRAELHALSRDALFAKYLRVTGLTKR